MTTLASRLGRLTPVLSAKERAILTIRSELAGIEPDPNLQWTMPREQRNEFNPHIALYYIANAELGTIVLSILLQAEALRRTSPAAKILADAASTAAEDLGEELDKDKVRSRHKKERVTLPVFLSGLSGEIEDIHRENALTCWKELGAIEAVWSEIADHFDGEDVIKADRHEQATEAKAVLRSIIETGSKTSRRLPQPEAEQVEEYRRHVEAILRMFHLLEEP